MPKIAQQEGETLEYKRQWTDRALEDLAAFANTQRKFISHIGQVMDIYRSLVPSARGRRVERCLSP